MQNATKFSETFSIQVISAQIFDENCNNLQFQMLSNVIHIIPAKNQDKCVNEIVLQ